MEEGKKQVQAGVGGIKGFVLSVTLKCLEHVRRSLSGGQLDFSRNQG